jgi:pheganomycin biosynthesis PGM1-like protein
VFLGCSFPAQDEYRLLVQDTGVKVGTVLARYGVVSRFAVDFLVYRNHGEKDWKISALEINLRMGGTTHPYLALQFLTGGQLDPATGLFFAPSGHTKYYRATDNLKSDAYRGLLPEDLIEILTYNKLHYSHGSEAGVLFHLIGALSEFGKLGLTAIANTREEVDELYLRTLNILDTETAYGR